MTSSVAWVLQRAGFYLPSSDVQSARISVWSVDSSPISSGNAEMVMTSDIVAWVLQRAGSYSPSKLEQQYKFSDVSDSQAPIDGGSVSNFIGAHDSPLQLRDVKFF